jgi:hypothetical protein
MIFRWEKRIRQELNAMAAELVRRNQVHQVIFRNSLTIGAGFTSIADEAQLRRQRQQHALRVRPPALQPPLSAPPFTSPIRYDDNDFYDVLATISNPNHTASTTGCVSWGVIKVQCVRECHAQRRARMYMNSARCCWASPPACTRH